MQIDILLKGGTVIDGTGVPSHVADVGIQRDRITAIGDLAAAKADRCIDATGMVVAPGFIDAHAHSDAYLLLEPDAPSKLAQGITTEINGQCGGSA
ncbi:MAG TPA: amidohydrolase family protein, partial [Kiritimatiellia bacterium]|nr:amidohydrolase family protein [Kiritimatiellia bacterium]